MYGVIIKESKGYFIPYTFEHFDKKEHNRLTRAFREECLFTKAGNGELSSDEFLSLLLKKALSAGKSVCVSLKTGFLPIRLSIFNVFRRSVSLSITVCKI